MQGFVSLILLYYYYKKYPKKMKIVKHTPQQIEIYNYNPWTWKNEG